MKAIIIAAGPATRLRPLTSELPKCMLEIDGKPIIKNSIDIFHKNGIKDISVIRGYKKEKINFPGITYFDNGNFWNNNILHSLMHARPKLEEALQEKEDVIVSYSDIWYTELVVKALLKANNDIDIVVDMEWQDYYNGRSDHPVSEAEKAVMDKNKKLLKIGKILDSELPKTGVGEFIGLWKLSPEGISILLNHFDRLNKSLGKKQPFQKAKEWQKAYMTDIFQEIINKGNEIYCTLIKKNWKEFDTVQDYERIIKGN